MQSRGIKNVSIEVPSGSVSAIGTVNAGTPDVAVAVPVLPGSGQKPNYVRVSHTGSGPVIIGWTQGGTLAAGTDGFLLNENESVLLKTRGTHIAAQRTGGLDTNVWVTALANS